MVRIRYKTGEDALRTLQREAALRTAELKRERTKSLIGDAVKELKAAGGPVVLVAVAEKAGICVRTAYRYMGLIVSIAGHPPSKKDGGRDSKKEPLTPEQLKAAKRMGALRAAFTKRTRTMKKLFFASCFFYARKVAPKKQLLAKALSMHRCSMTAYSEFLYDAADAVWRVPAGYFKDWKEILLPEKYMEFPATA